MLRKTAVSLVLLTFVILDVVAMPLLTWYVVDSPEVPTRDGQLVLFYVDRINVSYTINGTPVPGYETYWSDLDEPRVATTAFTGTMALNALVAIFSGIAILILFTRDKPRLRKWTLASLAVLGWVATLYFVVTLSYCLAGWDSYFPGFYGSVPSDWTDAWTYYGPGTGWYLMMANAILATLIFVIHAPLKSAFPRKSVRKNNVVNESGQNKEDESETEPLTVSEATTSHSPGTGIRNSRHRHDILQ